VAAETNPDDVPSAPAPALEGQRGGATASEDVPAEQPDMQPSAESAPLLRDRRQPNV